MEHKWGDWGFNFEPQNEQNNDVVIEINDQEEKSSSENKSDFASKIKSSSPTTAAAYKSAMIFTNASHTGALR